MKKIIMVILVVVLLITSASIPTSACFDFGKDEDTRPVDKTEFETEYPYVFVHGMGGWGPSNKFYKLSPYWGGGLSLSDTDVIRMLNEQGVEAYAAEVGPLNSAWDRA